MAEVKPVTYDYETEPIRPRPEYPPRPVGISIKYPNQPSRYYAFGHPMGNNCSEEEAKHALELAWQWPGGLNAFNHKFDLDVAVTHWGLPMLTWEQLHDPMLEIFLDSPHAPNLALKPSAERILGMPPEEQEAVRDWLMANQEELRETGWLPADVKLSLGKNPKDSPSGEPQGWAAWICLAPGDLVGKYANGDVIRTEKLHNKLLPSLKKRKMLKAYGRERKLIPILLEIERQGIRIDTQRLADDVASYQEEMTKLDKWLLKQLRVEQDFNLDSGQELVKALAAAGMLDLDKLGVTPKSKLEKPTYCSDQKSLAKAMTNAQVAGVLTYRSQLATCLSTFMEPWLRVAERSGGLIFTQWHQIRNEKGGARTGRFSSSPNFQNIPKEFKPIFVFMAQLLLDRTTDPDERKKLLVLTKALPKAPFVLPELPLVRGYIIPFKPGQVLVDRDWSQQEPRIFGHFEGGVLQQAYNDNPWLDLHEHASDEIFKLLNKRFHRKLTKIINLGLLYGKGIKLLASEIEGTEEQARELKSAVLKIFPGLDEMNKDMRYRAQNNLPIRTWGGREYYCEPAKMIDGRLWTFDYKMVNLIVQGSAADCMKEALIEYWQTRRNDTFFLMQIHDEFLLSSPADKIKENMRILNAAMESPNFDVPMLSEGAISTTDFAHMIDFDKKGKRV